MDRTIQIFPFFTKPGTVIKNFPEIEDGRMTIRGLVCTKKEVPSDVCISLDGAIFNGNVFYWHPITRREDSIQKGIELVRKGLQ